jgi:hypothetical protein
MLKHIEKWNGFTILQAALMFFPKNINNYTYARKRLHILHERNIVRRYTSNITNEYIYYDYDVKKPPREHEVFSMQVFALLKHYGANITYFKRDQHFMNDKIRPDFFTIFEFNGSKQSIIGEVNLGHEAEIQRLEDFAKTGEMQEKLQGDFPIVLVMSNKDKKFHSDEFPIINLNIHCDGFWESFLKI